jgi:polyisoprenoid-binding protein YceI
MHMAGRLGVRTVLGSLAALAISIAFAGSTRAQAPLAIDSARVTISGTSNIHPYTAATTSVRVTRAQLSGVTPGLDVWASVLKPGAVDAFEVEIPAATLTSPREGLDKNMHKALQVKEHPAITFRLRRLEPGPTASTFCAVGFLKIAGVEREVTLDLTTERRDSTLAVQGRLQLLMTDYGIKPPVAMLGMLKTDPKVTVTFETVLAVPQP